ncbi:MAG: universal stress protein [Spongiibacteraceae bacterium]
MIRITVPLDGSVLSEQALHHALAITKAFPAELTLLRVVNNASSNAGIRTDIVDFALERRQAEIYLKKICDQNRSTAVSIQTQVTEGLPADAITHFCKDQQPDLVIMTRYGAGNGVSNAMGFSAGGTVQKVIMGTDCSVLLIDPQRPLLNNRYRHILVPVDDGLDCEYVLGLASMIAQTHEASLLLLNVCDEPQLPISFLNNTHASQLKNDLQCLLRQHAHHRLTALSTTVPDTVQVEKQLLASTDAPFTIDAAANSSDADLIVIHAKAPNCGTAWRYGSIVHSLLQYSHRPLLIVQTPIDNSAANNFRSILLQESQRDAG